MTTFDELYSVVNSEKRNPMLETANGIGASLFGRYRPVASSNIEFKMHWICLFFIPLIPLGIYLLEVENLNPIEGTTYGIYGKIGIIKYVMLYGVGALLQLLLTSFFEAIGKIIVAAIVIAILTGLGFLIAAMFGQSW